MVLLKKHMDFYSKLSSRMALGPILGLPSTSLGLFLANFGGPFGSVSSPVCAGRSPWFKNYFCEAVTGQQKSKMHFNLNLVCNRFVFLGFVSPKVLTFTFLLHFATTTYENSNHLDEKLLALPQRLGEAPYNK